MVELPSLSFVKRSRALSMLKAGSVCSYNSTYHKEYFLFFFFEMKKDLVSTKTNGLLTMCLWREGTPSFNIAIIGTPIRIKQIFEQFNEAAQHPG